MRARPEHVQSFALTSRLLSLTSLSNLVARALRWILPVAVFGIVSRMKTRSGHLNCVQGYERFESSGISRRTAEIFSRTALMMSASVTLPFNTTAAQT